LGLIVTSGFITAFFLFYKPSQQRLLIPILHSEAFPGYRFLQSDTDAYEYTNFSSN